MDKESRERHGKRKKIREEFRYLKRKGRHQGQVKEKDEKSG